MRRLEKCFFAGWFVGLLSMTAFAQTDVKVETYSLQDAVQRGLVDVQIGGLGSASGDSLKVKVQRRAGVTRDFDVDVQVGTKFQMSGDVQEMAAYSVKARSDGDKWVNASKIEVRSGDATSVLVEAYCLDVEAETPEERHNAFVAVDVESPVVTRILKLGKRANVSVKVMQAAIWMETNDVDNETLTDRKWATDVQVKSARELYEQAKASVDDDQELTEDSYAQVEVALKDFTLLVNAGATMKVATNMYHDPLGLVPSGKTKAGETVQIIHNAVRGWTHIITRDNHVGFVKNETITPGGPGLRAHSVTRVKVDLSSPYTIESYANLFEN